jgi:hypothetical protein
MLLLSSDMDKPGLTIGEEQVEWLLFDPVSTYTVVVSTPIRVKPKNHQTRRKRRNRRRILKEF